MTPHSPRRGSSTKDNPLAAIDFAQLKELRWQELAARFAFGAAISLIAGVVGIFFGERVGGLFLAFPAILPATLTLVAKKEGEKRSFHDLQGTVAGAFGFVGFGVVTSVLLGHFNIVVVLVLALLTWALLAVSLYVVWATWLRRRGEQL